ncbi:MULTISPECIES: helix-turn-helix transcriptional regulator [unclassified Clostridium]|uniref:substrate-binding domain-containing protein n=1 Tax=Clostridium TaxID=1485 RepID=UPI001C8C8894|nr:MULTISPECIES: helix-turn-helix transcriptional regulator [unclassified Clostridium]MBX9137437.1 helix-turn-helix transcriptional regulator [Clostridium sp. K12(2020)]MBX9144239.1 helix-turn-helix transcriptional regulator [Clostridium sp. K13]MDU2289879.1 helix-turn-helix transcriptional regulator [Clostridium celatum]MDU4325783.1 helix-turn-helix transcriptional regulator [Clostridium celatum]
MNLKSSLTPLEVSELLKITKNTVYELIKRGELPSYKIGKKIRIDMHDVEEYINNQKSNSKPSINRNIINNSLNNNISNITTNNISLNNPTNSEIIISGQDILLDVLARYIEEILPDYTILRSYKGSYNGLYDLYNNKVSIASCHLWDGDNDSYNFDYVKRLLPGTPCILVNLAYRLQGFYVAKGNPLNINSFEDLTNKNIKFINREKGSGVRVLLDEKLRLLNIDPNSINGYYNEENSHLAVASTVGRGDANVGLGNKKASMQVETIDFIPLQTERYDLIIKKSDLNNPIYQNILSILSSEKFKNELYGIGGYDLKDLGKIMATT